MHDLDFVPSKGDPDVWMRPATKPDGYKHYEYIMIYVDDILCLSHQADKIMDTIDKLYRLKTDPKTGKAYDKLDRYLGAKIEEYQFEDDLKSYWSISEEQYVLEAVKNMEAELAKMGRKLNSRAHGPLANSYKPELDVSSMLDPKRANYYQNLIGVLRWAVELGRIDIHYHVAIMSSTKRGLLGASVLYILLPQEAPNLPVGDGQFIY